MNKLYRREIIGIASGSYETLKSHLPQEYKQPAMFIYKSKPRFHTFCDLNQLLVHIESEAHSIILNSLFKLFGIMSKTESEISYKLFIIICTRNVNEQNIFYKYLFISKY